MISLVVLFGVVELVKDYHLENITGSAISGDFEIESFKEATSPVVGVLLGTEDHKLREDVTNLISEREGNFLALKQTTIPAREDDEYLFLEWNNKLNLLSLYMKKDGERDASFEIWGPNNVKIASGELTEEYKWYHFKVSSSKMSSENYAIFNYGGDSSDILVDRVLGISKQGAGLSKLTGMMVGRLL